MCVKRIFFSLVGNWLREIAELTRFSVCPFEKLNLHDSMSLEAKIKAVRILNSPLARRQTRAGVGTATWPFDADRLSS